MRKLVTTMVAASPADTPMRRTSASSSDLARSVWYLTSRVISLTASETRSPTDRSSTSAGLPAPGSAIALFPPAPGYWGALAPSGAARTARHASAASSGQPTGTGQAPCAEVTSRLRQEILRDHHHAAGQHTSDTARLAWPRTRASERRSRRSAVADTSGPGYQAHIHCAGRPATAGTGDRCQCALADCPGSPPAAGRAWVPGCRARTRRSVKPFYDGSAALHRCCAASIGDLD